METEKKEIEKVEPEKVEAAESCECESEKCGCEKYKKFIPRIISAVILILVVGSFGYYKLVWRKNNLTAKEARTKVESFINENLIQPGTKMELEDAVKESGMFKMKITIGEGEQKQDTDAYLSLDGKKFIVNPLGIVDIAEVEQEVAERKKKEEEAEKNIPKSEKPKVDLYVMSFCPYGNKAEDIIKPVYDLLKNKADFNFRYIVNLEGNKVQSLHGEPEVLQNKKEACVLKYHGKDKWFEYVGYINKNCGKDGSCSDAGLKEIGLVPSKISACASSEGLSLMKEDAKVSEEANAQSSPTLIVNGKQVSFSNISGTFKNPEDIKQIICNGFNIAPEECAKTLAADTTTTEGGSCN